MALTEATSPEKATAISGVERLRIHESGPNSTVTSAVISSLVRGRTSSSTTT